jgi:hypothetical protein
MSARLRRNAVIGIASILLVASARAQATLDHPLPPATPEPEAPVEKWSFTANVFTFAPPHDQSYASPVITADRGWAHIEARYNYEALDTGSLYLGYNFEVGDEWKLAATPMLGGVFGDTTGVAPGYELALTYKRFELYTEGQYVFDTRESSDSFFYSWSELTYSPSDWLRFGLVAQRTRAYQTDLDIQRGVMLGLTLEHFDFTAYIFNVGWDDPLFVFSLGFSV